MTENRDGTEFGLVVPGQKSVGLLGGCALLSNTAASRNVNFLSLSCLPSRTINKLFLLVHLFPEFKQVSACCYERNVVKNGLAWLSMC